MAAGTKRTREEEEEDLDEVRPSRGRIVTDGFDFDSDDEKGTSHRARWQKQQEEDDDEDDMFAAGDKPEPEQRKEPRSLKLSEIEGQEFGERTLAHSDDEDDDELDPEYALAQSNRATDYQDANADAERTPPGSPGERDKRGMGFKIDGFNMKAELASGQFDAEGNYTWNAKDPYSQSDRWLEGNYSRKQMRAAQEAQKARVQREKERVSAKEAAYPTEAHALKALAQVLEPGESVLEGLQAAGAAKKTGGVRAAQLDPITDLTAILMSEFGLMNIYDETYEAIVRKVRRAGLVSEDWDPKRVADGTGPTSAPGDSDQFEYKWSPTYLAAMARANGSNVDPEMQVFGPFSRTDILSWASQGYFGAERENIRLRRCGDSSWLKWTDVHIE